MPKKDRSETREEQRLWVQNDEGLYKWWKSSEQSLDDFISTNKVEIAKAIRRVVNAPPRSHFDLYGPRQAKG